MSLQSTGSGVAGPDRASAHRYRSMPPKAIKTVLMSHKKIKAKPSDWCDWQSAKNNLRGILHPKSKI